MSNEPQPGSQWRHVRRGTVYEVVALATLEAGGVAAVAYRIADGDGRTWVRPLAEFCDGRFVALEAEPADELAPTGWCLRHGAVFAYQGQLDSTPDQCPACHQNVTGPGASLALANAKELARLRQQVQALLAAKAASEEGVKAAGRLTSEVVASRLTLATVLAAAEELAADSWRKHAPIGSVSIDVINGRNEAGERILGILDRGGVRPTTRANPELLRALAVLMSLPPVVTVPVLRCVPSLDEQSARDLTAVCSRCGRRLTMDDMGGGPPGPGPARPLPACTGPASAGGGTPGAV